MPRVKSRNYAEAYKSYAAQVIPQIDPREIGSTFHRAGADIAEKGHFWMETLISYIMEWLYIGKLLGG